MKRILACAIAAFALPAYASTSTSDWSDLWWNPNESGWGVNLIQQGDTAFLTFFVYGADGTARWYSASDVRWVSVTGTTQNFQGSLYETRGLLYGGATQYREVGNVLMAFANLNSATLTYTVDGVLVSKQLQRYTFRLNNLAGSFIGLLLGTYSNCTGVSYQEEISPLTITHSSDNTVTIATAGDTTCDFRGSYTQAGRIGTVAGTVTCSSGVATASGTFRFFDIEPAISGLVGRGTMSFNNGCSWSGRLGWVRRFSSS